MHTEIQLMYTKNTHFYRPIFASTSLIYYICKFETLTNKIYSKKIGELV